MRTLSETQFSILELAPVREDQTVQLTLQHSLKLAQQAERLGYNRLWLAEHHNMDGIASSATAVLLGYLLANTSTVKVGSAGVSSLRARFPWTIFVAFIMFSSRVFC